MANLAMSEEVRVLEEQIAVLKGKLVAARRRVASRPVGTYTFTFADGRAVSLAELFGSKRDLLVVHNMGRSCPYCTLWADGFNGLEPHIRSRCELVLMSPDDPTTLARFAQARGWTCPVVSGRGSTFTSDMGFEPEPGKYGPGVSSFQKHDDGRIERVGFTTFGPGDDFCAVWPLFDLLANGSDGWEPKYAYVTAGA